MPLPEDLTSLINDAQAAPYLFVGSGFSRRYLGTPDWEGLLRSFCSVTGKPYEYFRAQAPSSLPRVASLMADAFYEKWWSDPQWMEVSVARAGECVTKASPLKLVISDHILKATSEWAVPPEHEAEVDLLRRAEIDGIFTTNWDRLLETIFPEYDVYVGQQEAIFSRSYGIGEVFKIHGCSSQPNSIVLTGDDYEGYNRRNVYLAAKLTTTFLEHPIVFLGYSLSDENIHQTLAAIIACLEQPQLDQLSKRLFFVTRVAAGEAEGISTALINVGNRDLRITRIITSSWEPVFSALGAFKRKFPARLLRQIKQHVYDLVHSSEPTGKLVVADIEDLDSLEDVEVVIGVGAQPQIAARGLRPISPRDLFEDLLDEGTTFDGYAREMVRETIEHLLRSRKYVPVFKHIASAGLVDVEGRPILDELPPRVRKVASYSREVYMDSAYAYRRGLIVGKTVTELENEYSPEKAARHITLADVEAREVLAFLQRHKSILLSEGSASGPFRQLACLYDRLRYGGGFRLVEPEQPGRWVTE